MPTAPPRHMIVLVADSLRYDCVARPGAAPLPYLEAHATRFTQARSAGCWTLPSTASMFTGLLPHEHRGTSQTRAIVEDKPTVAALLEQHGWAARQLTNNAATTHIFGLHRGFEHVERVWRHVEARGNPLYNILILLGKPRFRERVLRGDFIMRRMSEDFEAGKSWVVSALEVQLAMARQLIAEHDKMGKSLFLFINVMDSHFPYQVSDEFALSGDGLWGKIKELHGLFHLVNQTRLLRERSPISAETLQVLRRRQQRAWDRIAAPIDRFAADVHGAGSTVVFCSDHGDNFGEDQWEYHFANVTDAGCRVPLYWLRGGEGAGRTVDRPVSNRDIYSSLLSEAGIGAEEAGKPLFHLCDAPERSVVATEAFWYNNKGRTRPEYRHNQFSFVAEDARFVHRRGSWHRAALPNDLQESPLVADAGVDAIEDAQLSSDARAVVREAFAGYRAFEAELNQRPAETH